jgi:DNA-binding response OmpR family regulator
MLVRHPIHPSNVRINMAVTDILIVDDNRDLADGLADVLADAGHQAQLAYSGAQASRAIANQAYDLVLLDIKLPDGSGLDVLRQIRTLHASTRVLVMTGFRTDQLIADELQPKHLSIKHSPATQADIDPLLTETAPQGIVLTTTHDPDLPNSLAAAAKKQGKRTALFRSRTDIINQSSVNSDLVVMALPQPLIDYLDVYRQLQENTFHNSCIFVKTLCHKPPDTDEVYSMEATGCCFKPFEPDVLLRSIEKWNLQQSHGEQGAM